MCLHTNIAYSPDAKSVHSKVSAVCTNWTQSKDIGYHCTIFEICSHIILLQDDRESCYVLRSSIQQNNKIKDITFSSWKKRTMQKMLHEWQSISTTETKVNWKANQMKKKKMCVNAMLMKLFGVNGWVHKFHDVINIIGLLPTWDIRRQMNVFIHTHTYNDA